MIQAVFLTHGMKHVAEELDILMDCEPYDDEVYNSFITLTEEQGEKLVKALGQRMLDKQKARTERDPYER